MLQVEIFALLFDTLFVVDKISLGLIAGVAERRHGCHVDSHRGEELVQDTTDHTIIE